MPHVPEVRILSEHLISVPKKENGPMRRRTPHCIEKGTKKTQRGDEKVTTPRLVKKGTVVDEGSGIPSK